MTTEGILAAAPRSLPKPQMKSVAVTPPQHFTGGVADALKVTPPFDSFLSARLSRFKRHGDVVDELQVSESG
ncbi:hypothetical protein EYF80_041626 [Liparis tanakae]|uniref:Uncharacterized protein n=1 Tax=Liparis tanakae TaxID=230148 RepID=A0A4Z2G3L5_9TELE|nr:hypothetical protein EYF80_041626 [Liparis tanakae]